MNSSESTGQPINQSAAHPSAEQSGEFDLVHDIAQATGQSPNDVTFALVGLLPERILGPTQTASQTARQR